MSLFLIILRPFNCNFREEKEGPPEKKFKHTAQVVVDQPEDPDKIVIDSVRDTSSWFEEVGLLTIRFRWSINTKHTCSLQALLLPSWKIHSVPRDYHSMVTGSGAAPKEVGGADPRGTVLLDRLPWARNFFLRHNQKQKLDFLSFFSRLKNFVES